MNVQPEAQARIAEIDIGRHARALRLLRLGEYGLVVTCGMFAASLLLNLLAAPWDDLGVTLFLSIAIVILALAAFAGWRNVGVIDPKWWRLYVYALPLLLALMAVMTLGALINFAQSAPGEFTFDDARQVGLAITTAPIALLAALALACLLVLRRTAVVPLGLALPQLLARLTARAGGRGDGLKGVRPSNAVLGSIYAALGVAMLLAVLVFPLWFDPEQRWHQMLAKQMNALQLGALSLLYWARRHFQVSADSLLALDKRSPMLFLRSFDDDEKRSYFATGRGWLDFSLETRLANHFHRFGPFVAIGAPKDKVPQIGAARVQLPDDQWQERVLGWMRDASVIIMYAGKTNWVNWELRQVIEAGRATRLILLVPEVKGWRAAKRRLDLDGRIVQIREAFRGTPWQEELAAWDDIAGLRAMLFVEDGSMVMVRSQSRSRDSYHLAALIAHLVMLERIELPQTRRAVQPAGGSLYSALAQQPVMPNAG